MKQFVILFVIATCCGAGCFRVKVDPVEVKPITLNVNLKIDRELDDFFAFQKEMGPASGPTTNASVTPVTAPTSATTTQP